jgi:hypothetical protein
MLAFSWHGMGWEPENSFLMDPFTDVPGERKVSGPRTFFTDAKGGMSGDHRDFTI